MSKVRVAVFGASGYAGEELLRILLRHPNAEVVAITSSKNAGEPVSTVFPRFTGAPLTFVEPKVDEIAAKCDAAILALPHGLATEYAIPLLKAGVKVFDISADFRLKSAAKYKEYYKVDHPAPELLAKAVYGLPELHREEIRAARLVGNPGCYTTCSILAAAPLLRDGLASRENVIIDAKSGVTGAGAKPSANSHFCEVDESLKAYNVARHRHTSEIEQELTKAAGGEVLVSFTPHLVPIKRGIFATVYLNLAPGAGAEQVRASFEAAYAGEPFVTLMPEGQLPEVKHVTGSNRCAIGFVVDERLHRVVVCAVLDNLLKGAAGQAVQNMNLLFGLPETMGLPTAALCP